MSDKPNNNTSEDKPPPKPATESTPKPTPERNFRTRWTVVTNSDENIIRKKDK